MAKTTVTSMRLTDLTKRQLKELAAALGLSNTQVITVAIDRLYQTEIVKRKKQ